MRAVLDAQCRLHAKNHRFFLSLVASLAVNGQIDVAKTLAPTRTDRALCGVRLA